MRFTMDISLDNQAFDGDQFPYEMSRILDKVKARIHGLHPSKPHFPHEEDTVSLAVEVTVVSDVNGNMVGTWSILEEDRT
jgi:hypothetical protein